METMLVPALVVIGLVVLGAVVVGGVVMLAGGAWFLRRNRTDPDDRLSALEAFGYGKVKPGQWRRTIQGTAMTYEERDDGTSWTVRLPRYNTMTLRVEERATCAGLAGAFETGDPDLDQRFALGSSLPAQTQALLGNRNLRMALLAMPVLSLDLGADELVVRDPRREGLTQLVGDAPPGSSRAVDAELELHQCVANLVNAFFRSLYTESGTVYDEHR